MLRTNADGSTLRRFSKPFPHFYASNALGKEASVSILQWLENSAPWRLVETDFYEQFEFSFWDIKLPECVSFTIDPLFLRSVKGLMQHTFDVRLQDHFDFTAHKLTSGQKIRIHNDFIPGRETHRLLVQLNRGWKDEDGGVLMFFNSSEPTEVHSIFRPIHNTAIGFEISGVSHHAVSTIHRGERFTLVWSLYAEGSN